MFFLRLILAAISGGITFLAVQPIGFWPAGIVGVGLLFAVLSPWSFPAKEKAPGAKAFKGNAALRKREGAAYGFVHGLVLYLLMLPWIGELVGAFPYIALAFSLSLYAILTGIGGVLIARLPYGFILFPFFYLAVELLRSSVPFGGFSWVRLAWGQIDGPLANLAPWGGPALITVATVAMGCGLVGLASRTWRLRGTAIAMIVLPLVLGLVASTGINNDKHTTDTVRVAAIQGNVPRLGLDFAAQRRAVLENHVNVTKEAAEKYPDLDLVFWPENSSDVNPFEDPLAGNLIRDAVDTVDAPLMVGTLTRDAVGSRNTMQVFYPGGEVGEHHHKKYLQPFGETMPMREFFSIFSEYVDRAGDFKPGNGPGVVDMGGVAVGVATCYEVSFDAAFRDSIKNGAQILATPTNNATFGFSDMTYQQLAMSRLRAMETDRAVVVPATSGVSAIVHPDGSVSQTTEIFEPGVLVEDLPLRDHTTFAVRFGSLVQWVMVIIGLVSVLIAVRTSRSTTRSTQGTT